MNTIREVNVYSATSLLSRPIADATHEISEIKFYIMEVITNRGVVGQGYLLAFNYSPGGIGRSPAGYQRIRGRRPVRCEPDSKAQTGL